MYSLILERVFFGTVLFSSVRLVEILSWGCEGVKS